MKVHLLDVNVLLSLAWPNHLHHSHAHAWMSAEDGRRWATCPLTQAAFVRLSCNARIVGRTVYPREALDILATNTGLPEHEFWLDDLPVAEAVEPLADSLVGHQQILDAYLLGLAIHRKEKLATLDQRMASLLAKESPHRESLEIIPL